MSFATGANYKRVFWVALALVVTIASLWLLPIPDLDPLLEAGRNADPVFTATALVLVIFAQFLRGFRIAILAKKEVLPLFAAYRISVAHNFLASLMPARSGELSLVILLARRFNVSMVRGTAILFLVRSQDLLLIAGCLGVSAYFLIEENFQAPWIGRASVVLGLVCFIIFAVQSYLANFATNFVSSLTGKHSGKILRAVEKFLTLISDVQISRIRIAQLFSLSIWVILFSGFYICTLAVGAKDISISTLILAATLGSFAFVMPVNGFAQLGPFEVAWSYAMILGGVSEPLAVASALLTHLVVFIAGAAQFAFVTFLHLATVRKDHSRSCDKFTNRIS